MAHESHEERLCLYVKLSPAQFFCNPMHMYALVSECDDDHARTHRALAHVANAEHLPVGRSLAVVIVGQLRLSMLKMRTLLKNWVGVCDQVMAKQRPLYHPNSTRANYARLVGLQFSCGTFAFARELPPHHSSLPRSICHVTKCSSSSTSPPVSSGTVRRRGVAALHAFVFGAVVILHLCQFVTVTLCQRGFEAAVARLVHGGRCVAARTPRRLSIPIP